MRSSALGGRSPFTPTRGPERNLQGQTLTNHPNYTGYSGR
jgi:hypothetical protein